MALTPYDWQMPCVDAHLASLARHGVFANGSEMGTGKTIVTCYSAKLRQKSLFVVCPKSVIPDWYYWAELAGVPCIAISYGKIRTGKTEHGNWMHKGKIFEWTIPVEADLVFDEAHSLTGLDTQQSKLLISAVRQKIPHILLSGTLMDSPLQGYAVGFSLGLHKLNQLPGFWQWAARYGVTQGPYGPQWEPSASYGMAIQAEIRQKIGDRFFRIRKSEVPGFPEKQVIPIFVQTDDMPDAETMDGGVYGYEARMIVELLKVPGLADKARDLIQINDHSVIIFVNYLDTLNALIKEFPEASVIRGGQSPHERKEAIRKFQANEVHVALVMIQAGGTGVSLHDLNGRPRSSIICPGGSSKGFLQAIDRIHRAAAQSKATIYVALASGVPVERRIRSRIEMKLNNLSALNDADFFTTNHNTNATDHENDPLNRPGALPTGAGNAPHHQQPEQPDQCNDGEALHEGADPEGGDHDLGYGGGSGPGGSVEGSGQALSDHLGQAEAQEQSGPDHCGQHVPTLAGDGQQEMVTRQILMPPAQAIVEAGKIVDTIIAGEAKAADAGNHVERKHARCSPSKLKNLEICPSYQGDNDGPVHPVTLRGTAMHEALETGNDSGLLTELGNEELRLVTMCRDFQDGEAVPGELVITEPHLKTHDADVQGFADRVVIEPANEHGRRHARVRDYKMGFNPVDSPDMNPQAIAYTVAVFLKHPDVDTVNFAFLIPRLDLVLEHTFSRSDLPAMKLRLSTIADRVRKLGGKTFLPNNDNCLYCGAKATCQALHDKVLVLARSYDDAEKLPLPATINVAQISDPKVMAYAMNMARIAQAWAESVNSYALKFRLELGVEIPGYDLIERSAKREIQNAVGVWPIVSEEFGVTLEEYLSTLKPSITKLETVVTDHAPQGDKAKVARAFTDRLLDNGLLTRGASYSVLQKQKKKAPKPVEQLVA